MERLRSRQRWVERIAGLLMLYLSYIKDRKLACEIKGGSLCGKLLVSTGGSF